jgi:hypothetical protein
MEAGTRGKWEVDREALQATAAKAQVRQGGLHVVLANGFPSLLALPGSVQLGQAHLGGAVLDLVTVAADTDEVERWSAVRVSSGTRLPVVAELAQIVPVRFPERITIGIIPNVPPSPNSDRIALVMLLVPAAAPAAATTAVPSRVRRFRRLITVRRIVGGVLRIDRPRRAVSLSRAPTPPSV